ncbi:MAG TPA: carbohydrate kinase family protein [Levilinea sp.]|nr:carbohydrate kinase family protein [Levilinea sp.]
MARILVSGLVNIETTLHIEGFPVQCKPVDYPFFGIHSAVSGAGYNLAKALTTLGDDVTLLSIVGQDLGADQVRSTLHKDSINSGFVMDTAAHTAQSVILYAPGGKRQIFADLKDIQDQAYPIRLFDEAMPGCELLALCNINFSRPFLRRALQSGLPVASDVQTINDLDDPYNRDFMHAAQILFLSDELLPVSPEEWASRILSRFPAEIVVIGLGDQGALLAVRRDHFVQRFPAAVTRPIVNTIGAGDALFSAFLHSYLESKNPYTSIQKALVFASYKVGARSAAEGFLNHTALHRLYAETVR